MSGMHACLLPVSCMALFCRHCLCTRLVLDALGLKLTQGAANACRSNSSVIIMPRSIWDCLQMGGQRQFSAQQHSLWGAVHHL